MDAVRRRRAAAKRPISLIQTPFRLCGYRILSRKKLLCSTFSCCDCSRDRAGLIATGGLTGEKQRVAQGLCQRRMRILPADAGVAVGAAAEPVRLPVVRVRRIEQWFDF